MPLHTLVREVGIFFFFHCIRSFIVEIVFFNVFLYAVRQTFPLVQLLSLPLIPPSQHTVSSLLPFSNTASLPYTPHTEKHHTCSMPPSLPPQAGMYTVRLPCVDPLTGPTAACSPVPPRSSPATHTPRTITAQQEEGCYGTGGDARSRRAYPKIYITNAK